MARKESPSKRAMRINEALEKKPITERQKAWAIEHIYPTQWLWRTVRRRKVYYCSECGKSVYDPALQKSKVCPHCGRRFKDEPQEVKSRAEERAYFCLMTTAEGLQALRFFQVTRRVWNDRPAEYGVWEVSRQLFDDNGNRWCFARSVCGMTPYYDQWRWGTPISYVGTHPENRSYRAANRNSLYTVATLIEHTTPRLHRNGIRKSLSFTAYPCDAVKRILSEPYMEQLLKMKQLDLLSFAIKQERNYDDETMAIVRVCHRHGYIVKDASIWIDYIRVLQDMGADTHNAHYVCPADLHKAHDKWMRKQAEKREAERIKKMQAEKQDYIKRMGALLTLSLSGTDLNVRPLQTVEEFYIEGKAMHHCVGSAANYWSKPNCLILSAKDDAGKRLATIEYNTQRHEIVQCRAACNAVPERDKEIRQLITDHRKDIEALLRQKEISTKATKKQKKQTAAVAA